MKRKFENDLMNLNEESFQRIVERLNEAIYSDELQSACLARIRSDAYKLNLTRNRCEWSFRPSKSTSLSEYIFATLFETEEFELETIAADIISKHPYDAIAEFGFEPADVMNGVLDVIMLENYKDKITGISKYYREWWEVLSNSDPFCSVMYRDACIEFAGAKEWKQKLEEILSILKLDASLMPLIINRLSEVYSCRTSPYEELGHILMDVICKGVAEVNQTELFSRMMTRCPEKMVEEFGSSESAFEYFCNFMDSTEWADPTFGRWKTFSEWKRIFSNQYITQLYEAASELFSERAYLEIALSRIEVCLS